MIYVRLWLTFARVGLFGFGGGMAMLPMIYQASTKFIDMTQSEFTEFVALSQMTPGPLGVNAATFVGYKAAGVAGGIITTLGEAFPSFVLVGLVLYFTTKYSESRFVKGIFVGIRPVTIGLICAAIVMLGGSVYAGSDAGPLGITVVMTAAAFAASMKTKISPIAIIFISGGVGALLLS